MIDMNQPKLQKVMSIVIGDLYRTTGYYLSIALCRYKLHVVWHVNETTQIPEALL